MKPFTADGPQSIGAWGEIQLIQDIQNWLGDTHLPAPVGIGDDCACLPGCQPHMLLTVDSGVLGRHWDETAHPAEAGAKLLKRNISDIAAMGGYPEYAVIACVLSQQVSYDYLKAFYLGLASCARDYGIKIVGGDLTQAHLDIFSTSLTLLGHSLQPVYRHGAQAQDTVWVTGRLGGSLLGHHLHFSPRLREGQYLSGLKIGCDGSLLPAVHAMVDLTDGLAQDAYTLLSHNLHMCIDLDQIPLSTAAVNMAQTSGQSAVEHALHDGEDYELLFTLDARMDPEEFLQDWHRHFKTPLTCIGLMKAHDEPSSLVYQKDATGIWSCMQRKGYEHFKTTS